MGVNEAPPAVNISIIIPTYNSCTSLKELMQRIVGTMDKSSYHPFELIFVDDASNDESWKVLNQLRTSDNRVKLIRLLKNSGQHLATYCGLAIAKGNLIMTMDDDLQHPPEEIPKLLDFINENPECDVVMGVPVKREHAVHRRLGSRLAMKIIDLSIGKPKGIRLSSFRAMNRPVVKAILNFKGNSFTIGSLICHATSRIHNIPVDHRQRKYGKSGYNFSKLSSLAITSIFNYTILPLQIISYLGLIMSFLAFGYFVAILYLKAIGVIQQAGFATITGLILFFSGLILFAFGIVGTYIGVIIKGVNFQEKFIIRDQDI